MKHTLAYGGLFLSVAMVATVVDARTLQLEDYLKLEQVTTPQLSPDGKSILYTRSRVNALEDRLDSEMWMMEADGGHDHLLRQGGAEIHWSPDSSRIAYLDKASTGIEIFVRRMDATGETIQITHEAVQPGSLRWSPDGQWIAFLGKVPAPATWTVDLPKPEGTHWTQDALVIDKLHHQLDGVGYTAGAYSHIFVVSAKGGTPKQITHGEWNAEPRKAGLSYWLGSLEWTRNSRSILFSADREPDADTHYGRSYLYAVEVETEKIRSIVATEGFWGMRPGPRVSPDGKKVAYVGTRASNTSNFPSLELHVVEIDGTHDRTLMDDLPSEPDYLGWDRSGNALYYVAGEYGARNIQSVSLSGKTKPVTQGAQSFAVSSVSDTGVAAGTLTSSYRMPDVVRFNLKDGKQLRQLTDVSASQLHEVKLGRVEEMGYESADHIRVQGWVTYPPSFDPHGKYPLVLDVHGGPEIMVDGDFNFFHQDMAAQGFVVLHVNQRGSAGYGGAFARLIYNDYPGRGAYEDLMKAVDLVTGRGFVDEKRIYLQGTSYGGAMVAWVVTQTQRFAAAAALCPIADTVSYAGTSDVPGWIFNHYSKPFWEDPTAWLASSPVMQAGKIKTPVLIGEGELDLRNPIGQSKELYTALKMGGVPTKLIVFHDEWHGISKPSNLLRMQLFLRKWYSENRLWSSG